MGKGIGDEFGSDCGVGKGAGGRRGEVSAVRTSATLAQNAGNEALNVGAAWRADALPLGAARSIPPPSDLQQTAGSVLCSVSRALLGPNSR
jgi:hypothetical protein